MFIAGTTRRKPKDTGVQDGEGARLLGNENNYCYYLITIIIKKKKNNSDHI